MRTWFKCIKRSKPSKSIRTSPFIGLKCCDYLYSGVYLGARGTVKLYPEDIVLQMSYSEKDGILVNIKRRNPYRILFDYVDGAYYINDENVQGYHHLVESLSVLKKFNNGRYSDTYFQLESILFEFVIQHYAM